PPSASQSIAINTASSADVRIGDDFQINHNWLGGMDDVRIYNEALDAQAISSLAIGTPIISNFTSSAEVVASGQAITLSWVSDPTNDSLEIDNGIGDVSNLTMVTVNPTESTIYILTGRRGTSTDSQKVRVLVENPPLINRFVNLDASTIIEGQSVELYWDVFGESAISLNGIDVTGEEQLTLSPVETTTYVLRTSNDWGVTTTALTVTVLGRDSPNLSWTAAGLPAGNLALWSPHINVTGNNAIRFVRNTGGTVQSGASNFTTVSQWINSPGFNLASNPNDSWQDGLGDLVTKANVTWEMVFRPGDFAGTHVLFNTGGNGDGTAITIAGSLLDFRFQDAATTTQRLVISKDLADIGTATDFYHVVCLADVDSATTGTAKMYVNGQLVAGPVTSAGTIEDWDGGDLAELGKGSNIPGSTTFAHTAFTGDIALFNYYGNRLLSE
ncbi:MAG: LamG domain-containing protein, partial [Planctomycetaceae bacterium]|nr:LamG domain-containing protein [Planctomycetaceae bacterium]